MSFEEFATYRSCVFGIGDIFGSPFDCSSSLGFVATMIFGVTPASKSGLPAASLPSSGSYCLPSAARAVSSDTDGRTAPRHSPSIAFDSHQRPSAQRENVAEDGS